MHAWCTGVEGDCIVVAVTGGELGSIRITVVITVPTSLKPNIRGIVHCEIQIVQRAILPDVGTITVDFLLDVTILGDVEDVPLRNGYSSHRDGLLRGDTYH